MLPTAYEKWEVNVRRESRESVPRGKPPIIPGTRIGFGAILKENEETGEVLLAQIAANRADEYKFDINVYPKRPTPGVFGAVMFARAFKLFQWRKAEHNYIPLEREYPESYYRNDNSKVVIKLVAMPRKETNIDPLTQKLLSEYLKEARIQKTIFNMVYGPKGQRKDIPLSPAFPNLQFAVMLNYLPPYNENSPIYMDKKIFETLARYFFTMYIRGWPLYCNPRGIAKLKKIKSKSKSKSKIDEKAFKEYLKKFSNQYNTMKDKYRLGMMVTEYAGKTLRDVFLKTYKLQQSKTPVEDNMALSYILRPVLFQLLHIRVVLNKLGYVHKDLKGDNILVQSLAEASEQSLYHTRTDPIIGNGELKVPLFSLDLPMFASEFGETEAILVNPLKKFQIDEELEMDHVYLVKLIDFGAASDRKKKYQSLVQDNPTMEIDLSKTTSDTYAANYRPPESFIYDKQGHVYHLSDTYALGILIIELVIGMYIFNLADVTSITFNWNNAYQKLPVNENPEWYSRCEEKANLFIHYYARKLLFVCLEELNAEKKLIDHTEYKRLKDIDSEDYNKYFMIKGEDQAKYIDWDEGGVFTEEQYSRIQNTLRVDAERLEKKYKLSADEIDKGSKSAISYSRNAKDRIKTILEEQGIYMLLKMLHSDPLKRSWSKEVIIEQLQPGGIFHYMIESENVYYDRIRLNGTEKGVTKYNLGLYRVSLDIARPYSQSRIPRENIYAIKSS